MKITLIGSTRFIETFHHWNHQLTLAGHVVYSVAMPTTGDAPGPDAAENKLVLDAIHMGKIVNSEAVFLITMSHTDIKKKPLDRPKPYVGESTAREMYFASVMDRAILIDTEFYANKPLSTMLTHVYEALRIRRNMT